MGVPVGVGDDTRVGFKVGVRVGALVAGIVGVAVGGRGVLVAAAKIFSSFESGGWDLNCATYSRVISKYKFPYVTLGSIIEPSTHSFHDVMIKRSGLVASAAFQVLR